MSEAGRRVRVCDDAVFMVFARRAAGQAAGHLFFGSFLWSEQRNERIFLNFLDTGLHRCDGIMVLTLTPSFCSRGGCIIKDTVVMLSERPNVRVHNDPLRMCPARESRLYVGTRNARGDFSLVRFFGRAKK